MDMKLSKDLSISYYKWKSVVLYFACHFVLNVIIPWVIIISRLRSPRAAMLRAGFLNLKTTRMKLLPLIGLLKMSGFSAVSLSSSATKLKQYVEVRGQPFSFPVWIVTLRNQFYWWRRIGRLHYQALKIRADINIVCLAARKSWNILGVSC